MTRRAFAGLFFGMGMGMWKAARKTGLPPSLADEELRRYGYDAWAREAGRKSDEVGARMDREGRVA